MSMPKPPCAPACTRRSPTCHNREFCVDWGIYQDAMARYRSAIEAARKEDDDYTFARKGHVNDDVLRGKRK